MKFKSYNICTRDLFLNQIHDGVFLRADIIVKYLAIENFFGINDFGFELYKKTIKKRKLFWIRYGKNRKDNYSINKFKTLIKSFKKNQYNFKYPIEVDKDFMEIRNGSHRFSCALFFDINKIPIIEARNLKLVDWSLEWFKKEKFDKIQIGYIADKLEYLCKKMMS